MLCLNRKVNESIVIGDDIRIVVMSVGHNVVKLGIEAPQGVTVHRSEVYEGIKQGTRGPMIRGEIGPKARPKQRP